jgi:hypothetical protein
MKTLRQMDYVLQLIFSVITLSVSVVLYYFGFLAGLFIIGCWQLLSAILNTSAFLNAGMGKEICNYWKFVGLVFVCFFLYYPLTIIFEPDDMQVIIGIGLVGAIPIAIYYLSIYSKLIRHFSMRDEVAGVIKSNHKS